MSKNRTCAGIATTTLGLSLLGLALHLGGHDDPMITGKAGTIVAGASAVGGGVLTFGVGRRLLASKTEESVAEGEDRRGRHG